MPSSSKSHNRDFSANSGKSKNTPASTIPVNASITIGRHERCSQFPSASVRTTSARLRCKLSNCRFTAAAKSAWIRFFSFDDTDSVFTTDAISSIKFEISLILFVFKFETKIHPHSPLHTLLRSLSGKENNIQIMSIIIRYLHQPSATIIDIIKTTIHTKTQSQTIHPSYFTSGHNKPAPEGADL